MPASLTDNVNLNVLALDVGTSSCKGAVYCRDGILVAQASEGYGIQRPAPMWVEQQPDDWWQAAQTVCWQLVREVGPESIAGVGLSGQVPTMLLVDEAGNALAPAITWQDRRAEAEAAWLRENVSLDQLRDWLGMDLPVDAGWPPARMLWWRRNQPDLLAQARGVLMAKDYLLLKLTGAFASDAWSAKGLIHLLTGSAPETYYQTLDISASVAPLISAPYAALGVVTDEAARLTGLRAGTPVVTGMSDALCGMAGTGAFSNPDIAFNLTGTSDITGCSGKSAVSGLLFIPAEITGDVAVLYGPTQSGGDSLAWFAEWVGMPIESVIGVAEATTAGASDLIFLPYLQGERAPLWDTSARGAFIGLMRQQGMGEGARAVMEGVAMSARHILELCDISPSPERVVRVAGGGARVPLWNQIRADVLGMTVEVIEQQNVATLGAAMLAAVGAGLYVDLSAASAMVRIETTYTPAPVLREHYERLYGRFRAAYPALKPVLAL